MSDIVIRAENVGKLYRLGEIGTGTISHDLNRWWAKMRGKEDPYLKIGQVNNREIRGDNNYVWALKDINFEVKHGEVVGFIGRNGAGKSTLLKLLSKVTSPTTGRIKIKGRIASLLEVGTGFHQELTGRENVFLNGAILGMNKAEIKSKFDAIVDFAGVERYIDTPVKRYSSGMYVRLAFAVAAFLEPEILIIDEVLAVGDAEFQKKCLGRMKDVSVNDGRTVLFVSHDISAIERLCDKTILLANGEIDSAGSTLEVLMRYSSNQKKASSEVELAAGVVLKKLKLGGEMNYCGDTFPLEVVIEFKHARPDVQHLCVILNNMWGNRVAILDLRNYFDELQYSENQIRFTGNVENCNLLEGEYLIGLYYGINNRYQEVLDIGSVTISESRDVGGTKYENQHRGYVHFNINATQDEKITQANI